MKTNPCGFAVGESVRFKGSGAAGEPWTHRGVIITIEGAYCCVRPDKRAEKWYGDSTVLVRLDDVW
jgi:hypothetical protein